MSRYFKNYEDKYNTYLSSKKPIIIKAKVNIDKNDIRFNVGNIKNVDANVRKITRDLSRKYNCLAFSSFNEINLVITDPKTILDSNKLESHNVVSLFSQEIFLKYNELSHRYNTSFISVNAFNIFEDKVKSYIYDRQSTGFNDYISFLSSRLFSYSQLKNKKREELLDILESISPNLKSIKKYIRNGFTTFNGVEIDIHDINKDNLKESFISKNNTKVEIASESAFAFDSIIEEDI